MDTLNLLVNKVQPLSGTVSAGGQLVSLSASLSDQLGYAPEELLNQPIERIYSVESIRALQLLFADPPADQIVHSLELTLIRHNGGLLQVVACGLLEWRSVHPPRLHLLKIPLGPLGHRLREMHNANEVMSQMLQSAKAAYWCIEFTEAVNINTSQDEIVRQVFENDSHWRMCNRAMAGVYEMPADVDFNQQPVRLYWPRSPANEEFVRRLIEAGFSVDCALSVDRRHDGSPAYVENDVRATIVNGYLLRMWGSIRDVSQELRVQHDAEQRIDALRRVFDAVPDAVLVIDEHLQPQWRNAAFEETFGITQGASIVRLLLDNPLPERTWHTLQLPVLSGRDLNFNVHCSRILIRESVAWRVAVFRESQGARRAQELHP
ncbi:MULTISPECIES: PAS domain-containing protein [unclassified Pseudomonas]|uniref:PAS domain-containing protein n=1 Tax=unclassified Pseudomonas TaxID=196821 RepID=UPI0015A2B997|nr:MULTISPECIES: PAS domain-containing protein [unclassified Pseudomonas]NWC93818.1 PAS domain-containing protein [Pseudomonas sp. IPO3779]NWD16208.1 PAS domain-containing protein [Pseudomonas sp. IPO3778]